MIKISQKKQKQPKHRKVNVAQSNVKAECNQSRLLRIALRNISSLSIRSGSNTL